MQPMLTELWLFAGTRTKAKLAFLFFLLLALSALGQDVFRGGGGGGAASSTNLPWGKTIYVDQDQGNDTTALRGNAAKPFASFTNALGVYQSGDLIVVRPGTYWTRTNTVPLSPAGTNFYWLDLGATLIFGQNGDDTTEPTRPLFTDKGGATTTYVWGFGNIYVSNKTARVVSITNSLSKIHITANRVWRANTNVGTAVFYQKSGDFSCDVQYARNDGYDVFWNDGFSGNAGVFNLHIAESAQVDTAFECSTALSAGNGYAEFGMIRFLPSTDAAIGQVIKVADNVYCRVGTLDLGTNGQVSGGFSGDINAAGVLEFGLMTASSTHPKPLVSASTMKLRGGVIAGHANADPVFIIGDGVTLNGVSVTGGATNSIRANNPQIVKTIGGTSWDLPLHANIQLTGVGFVTNRLVLYETADVPPRPSTNSVQLFATDFTDNISRFGWIDDRNQTNIFSPGSPSAGQAWVFRNNVWTNESVSGAGDVTAAANFGTDNTALRADGTGKGAQSSGVVIGDTGDVSGIQNLTITNTTARGWRTTIGVSTNGDTTYLTNGAIAKTGGFRIDGATSGSHEFATAGTTQTNKFVFNMTAPSAGQVFSVHAVAAAGGTNVVTVTNASVAGAGDVTAASTFGTDNTLIRADGTGKGVQSSGAVLSDTGDLSGIQQLTVTNAIKRGWNYTVGVSTNGDTLYQTNQIKVFSSSGPSSIILAAATSGSFEITPAIATIQTNSIVPNIVAPSAGQVLAVHAVAAAGGTNVITLTNLAAGVAPDDTAFASSWNGVTGTPPSKNVVYDWGHIFDTDDDGKVNVLDQGVGIAITDSSGVLQTPVTTSALLAAALGDETGSGADVFANGPSLGTFGSSTNANLNFVYITNNNAFTYSDEMVATNSTVNSNLTMNVNVAIRTLYLTNNISVTNFSNTEVGTSKTVTWHLWPTLVNRTIVYPTLGAAGHAVRWYTNANSPMWTTLTNGNCYVLSVEWRNTNAWCSISEWK